MLWDAVIQDPIRAFGILASIAAVLAGIVQFWRHARLPKTEDNIRSQIKRVVWMILALVILFRLLQMQ